MRKLTFSAVFLAILAFAVPAFAGHSTYYKIKGGSATVSVSAASELKNDYGIGISKKVGPLKLKRGGSVYQSSNAMTADFSSGAEIKVTYDSRGPDGKKGEVKTVKIKRLSLTIGKKNSMIVGQIDGVEKRIFNIGGGKVKRSKSKKYAYTFSSKDITFNSELTNLLNDFGTPIGNKHASAKVDLGSITVKVK